MQSRSTWQLYLPLIFGFVVSAISGYAMLLFMAWTLIGFLVFMILGVRPTTMGHCEAWRSGTKKVVLVAYHVFWWPWFIFKR